MKMLHSFFLSCFLCSVLFWGMGVKAFAQGKEQKPAVESYENLSLEELLNTEIVTSSKRAQKISDAIATVTVITEQQIKERGYKDLKDIFRDLPGFDISENVEGEVRTLVMNRGILGNNKMMILIDSKKINSPAGENFVYGNNLPLAHVKRIEVVYGPSSEMYGADAYAGVVNIITKGYTDANEAEVSYGKNNTLDAAAFLAHQLSDDIAFSLSMRYYTSGGIKVTDDYSAADIFRNASVYGTYNTKWEQPIKDYNILAKVKLQNITVGYYRMDAKEPTGPSTDVTGNGISFMYNKDNFWHQIINKIYLEHNYDAADFSVTSTASYTDYTVDKESGFLYNFGPQYKYAKSTSFKLDELLNYTFNEKTKLTAGLMWEQISAFPKTNNLATQFDPKELYDYVVYPNDPSIDPRYRNQKVYFGVFDNQNFAAYGEITRKLMDNLTLNAGVRYDYNSDYKEVFNPRAGLVWEPDDKSNIKLLYTQAYIQPSKYNAYEHWSAGTFGFYPNPELKPEKLKNFSVNLSRYFTPNLSVALNTYLNKIENLIVQDGRGAWQQNINLGKPETKGFELLVDYMFSSFKSYVYYSYLDAKQENGTLINKLAQNKINAGVTYSYDKYSISPRVRWSSKIRKVDGTDMDGHFVVDLSLRGENIYKNLSAHVTITNLLNTKYYAATPFEEVGWLMSKAPQPGMDVEAGLNLAF